MKIKELINEMEYEILAGSEETEITTLVYDSRKVEKGSVFVCISGSVRDAHEFIPDVAAKGAAARPRPPVRCCRRPGGRYARPAPRTSAARRQ